MSDTTTLTPQQTFEENIKGRMRKDIGELLPDSVLADLMQKSLTEMFFTRREHEEGYGYDKRKIIKSSWFDEEVTKVLDAQLRQTIREYFDKNGDAIAATDAQEIAQQAPKLLANILIEAITQKVHAIEANAQMTMENRLREVLGQSLR